MGRFEVEVDSRDLFGGRIGARKLLRLPQNLLMAKQLMKKLIELRREIWSFSHILLPFLIANNRLVII